MRHTLSPSPLKKGDTLGIIAPAGQMQDEGRFRKGVKVLQEMGFQVRYPPNLWPGMEYLADSDHNRGFEYNSLLLDEEIKGLIAMRGGYGCLRMLDTIDLSVVSGKPKFLVGFSDITILQNYLYEQTGLISLHGPVVTSLGSATEEARTSLFCCLTQNNCQCIESTAIEVLRAGPEISAPLVGGNLASLVTLLGTRYDFSWDNKIVFLEDINEPAYKIDRMLTQLKLAGKFDNITGLILGDFSISANENRAERAAYKESIWNRILALCDDRLMPIWGNFPSGHYPGSLTFPLGAISVMEGENKRLRFL